MYWAKARAGKRWFYRGLARGDGIAGATRSARRCSRANIEVAADRGLLLATAAEALEAAAGWLDGSVASVYLRAGRRPRFSLQVELSNGRAALLGGEINLDGEPSARPLIVGRHGTLRIDDFPEAAQLAHPTIGAAARWIPPIERALATGRQARAAER